MMKKLLILSLIILLNSCNNQKEYKYIELINDEQLNGTIIKKENKADTIKEENDSMAYLSAYRSFKLHQKLYSDYIKYNVKTYTKPISYRILNEDNIDITKNESKYNLIEGKKNIDIEVLNYDTKIKETFTSQSNNTNSYSNTDSSANPCVISEDFIKQDLKNPATADFSMFDCSTDKNSDGTFTIMRKVTAQNSFGVEKEYVYKLKLGFKGGDWLDLSNWDLLKIQSEEYRN